MNLPPSWRRAFHHFGAVVFPLGFVDGAVAHIDGVDQGVRVQGFARRLVERGFAPGVAPSETTMMARRRSGRCARASAA